MPPTASEIRTLADDMDVPIEDLGDDAAVMRAATRALATLNARVLGWHPTADDLTVPQAAALDQAIALQTIFEFEQGPDDYLGVDDRLSSAGGLSFAPRAAPRVSEAARDALAGAGLVRRSGTLPAE